jgi:Helix-turn-helix domain
MPDELMTVKEARAVLGVGTRKIAALIASGTLPTQPDPLDERVKLIKRSDVDALLARSKREKAA